MQRLESQLLDNLLDCLDRLFDGETAVIDVHDLVFATLAALSDSPHAAVLANAEKELIAIARSRATRDQRREAALHATDDLRKHLASVLPFPNASG
ncbi:MAG: hypothetical protein KDB11_33765 [Planctomycetales bacterium]|nr:hypothetical protein [Planctomycetales bacterium]